MKRLIDYHLLQWKDHPYRKSLVIWGARQVGKTYAIREFAKQFLSFVEVNLEENNEAQTIFAQHVSPQEIVSRLEKVFKKEIISGSTLLFIDEIQAVPQAITALRYFYEKMPELHVIAAGSLLPMTIQKDGMPVGRITFLHMYPVSFIEYLVSTSNKLLVHQLLKEQPYNHPIENLFHEMLLNELAKYIAIGGMPMAVQCWAETQRPLFCLEMHAALDKSLRNDFFKYAKKTQIKYLTMLYHASTLLLGKQFKYSAVTTEYRKRELEPSLDSLVRANLIHKVKRTAAQGLPLGAQASETDFKLVFLDVGLAQKIAGQDTKDWFINPLSELINKGSIVESFVGQEIVAYSNPIEEASLYYWHREERGSSAEVDYVARLGKYAIPIEVKSGPGSTLRSLHSFLSSHPQSPYGIRFSTHNFSIEQKIHFIPLYAVAKPFYDDSEELRKAMEYILTTV